MEWAIGVALGWIGIYGATAIGVATGIIGAAIVILVPWLLIVIVTSAIVK